MKKTKSRTKKTQAPAVPELLPNEMRGYVIETNVEYNPMFGSRYPMKHMTLRWMDGTSSSHVPMNLEARPGDCFIVSLRPA